MNKKVLIIGLIWPEPDATAAGTRMKQLIHFFLDQNYDISFASAAKKSDLSMNLEKLLITTKLIQLNHFTFDDYIRDLDPGIVVYDRFLTEEQYGWRIREVCPKALRIMDTEDLHFLRKARETALAQNNEDVESYLKNDTAKREIASIYRCDLSLVISKYEESLLLNTFKIDQTLILYLPFLLEKQDPDEQASFPVFKDRSHFMTMGNFKHQPNWDSILYLKNDIWPLIRKKLPGVELHVYGAYASEKALQLNNKKEGFIIKGWISEKKEAFIHSRLCLAPLRFGAGLKGKLIDAMQFGTPSVSSSISAEGIQSNLAWNGYITDNTEDFAQLAVRLYSHEQDWKTAQSNGFKLLHKNFNKQMSEDAFQLRISQLLNELEQNREKNFIGSMLAHHTLQSTKYLSKWIEVKNANEQ